MFNKVFDSHPKGLITLFYENVGKNVLLWNERNISPFMTASISNDGLNLDPVSASNLWDLCLKCIFGCITRGWIADRSWATKISIIWSIYYNARSFHSCDSKHNNILY